MNVRVLAVTGLLALLGGLAGALGGAVLAVGLLAVIGEMPSGEILRGIFGTSALVGFGVGVIAGPLLSWTLLRRAPIWRAIGEPALGAGLGAAVAMAVTDVGFWPTIAAAVASATLAALRLRRAVTRTPAAPTS